MIWGPSVAVKPLEGRVPAWGIRESVPAAVLGGLDELSLGRPECLDEPV